MNRYRKLLIKCVKSIIAVTLVCCGLTAVVPSAAYAESRDNANSLCAKTLDEPSLLASIIFSANKSNTTADSAQLSYSEIASYAKPEKDGYCYGDLTKADNPINGPGAAIANRLKTMSTYGWFVSAPRTSEDNPHWMYHAIMDPSSNNERALHGLLMIASGSGSMFTTAAGFIAGFRDFCKGLTVPGLLGLGKGAVEKSKAGEMISGLMSAIGLTSKNFQIIWGFALMIIVGMGLLLVISALHDPKKAAKGGKAIQNARVIAIRIITIIMLIPVSTHIATALNKLDAGSANIDSVLQRFAGNYVVDTLMWAAKSNLAFPNGDNFSSTFDSAKTDEQYAPTRANVQAIATAVNESRTKAEKDADKGSKYDMKAGEMLDALRMGSTASVNDYFALLNKYGSTPGVPGVSAAGSVAALDVGQSISSGREGAKPFNFNAAETYMFAQPDENHQVASEAARNSAVAAMNKAQEEKRKEIIDKKLESAKWLIDNNINVRQLLMNLNTGTAVCRPPLNPQGTTPTKIGNCEDEIARDVGKAVTTDLMQDKPVDIYPLSGGKGGYGSVEFGAWGSYFISNEVHNGDQNIDRTQHCLNPADTSSPNQKMKCWLMSAKSDNQDILSNQSKLVIAVGNHSWYYWAYELDDAKARTNIQNVIRKRIEASGLSDAEKTEIAEAGKNEAEKEAEKGGLKINVYGAEYTINRLTTPAALAPRKISLQMPTSYLYGAIPASALDEYSKALSNYTYGQNNALKQNSPESGKTESDKAKKESLENNAVALAILNKYQGSSKGLSYQSTAFLLQSSITDNQLTYNGFNTVSNTSGEAKNVGTNGNAFLRYVMPATDITNMSLSAASIATVFTLSALLGFATLIIILKSPVFGAIAKSITSFIKAIMTGNVAEGIRYILWLIVLRVVFIVVAGAIFIAGSLGLLLIGDNGGFSQTLLGIELTKSSVAQTPVIGGLLSSMTNAWQMFVLFGTCLLVGIALCLPVFTLQAGNGGLKKVSVLSALITLPFLVAEALSAKLDELEQKVYGKKSSGGGIGLGRNKGMLSRAVAGPASFGAQVAGAVIRQNEASKASRLAATAGAKGAENVNSNTLGQSPLLPAAAGAVGGKAEPKPNQPGGKPQPKDQAMNANTRAAERAGLPTAASNENVDKSMDDVKVQQPNAAGSGGKIDAQNVKVEGNAAQQNISQSQSQPSAAVSGNNGDVRPLDIPNIEQHEHRVDIGQPATINAGDIPVNDSNGPIDMHIDAPMAEQPVQMETSAQPIEAAQQASSNEAALQERINALEAARQVDAMNITNAINTSNMMNMQMHQQTTAMLGQMHQANMQTAQAAQEALASQARRQARANAASKEALSDRLKSAAAEHLARKLRGEK